MAPTDTTPLEIAPVLGYPRTMGLGLRVASMTRLDLTCPLVLSPVEARDPDATTVPCGSTTSNRVAALPTT